MINVRRERGFGIVEVLIALFIIAFAIAGATAMVTGAFDQQSRTKLQGKLASVAEGVWDAATSDPTWRRACTTPGVACRIDLNVAQLDISDADVKVTIDAWVVPVASNGTITSYELNVKVEATDASGQKIAGLDAATLSGAISGTQSTSTGTLIINSCKAQNQADERMPVGSCGGAPRDMPSPSVSLSLPSLSAVQTWPPLLTQWKSNPSRWQWERARAASNSTPYPTKVLFSAARTTIEVTGKAGTPSAGVHVVRNAASVTVPGLPAGEYTVQADAPSGYVPWYSKWAPRMGEGTHVDTTVTVGAGLETSVMRVFKPAPVTITMDVRTVDGSKPWKPAWWRNPDTGNQTVQLSDEAGKATRFMLTPFPTGRVATPGLNDNGWVTVSAWGKVVEGDNRTVTFRNVEPGLYLAKVWRYNVGKSNSRDQAIQQRTILRKQVGQPPTYSQNINPAKVPFLYVYRNGTTYPPLNDLAVTVPHCDRPAAMFDNWPDKFGNSHGDERFLGSGWLQKRAEGDWIRPYTSHVHGSTKTRHYTFPNGNWRAPSYPAGLNPHVAHPDIKFFLQKCDSPEYEFGDGGEGGL